MEEQVEKKEDSLIAVTLKEADITGSKAQMIESAFAPMVEMLKGFEAEYKTITEQPINEYVCNDARALRLKMVKVRTGAKEIHKAQKEEVLRFGRGY